MAYPEPQPAPRVLVMKFGGSSVADPDKIKNVARRLVDAHRSGRSVVGVVSAPALHTRWWAETGSRSPSRST